MCEVVDQERNVTGTVPQSRHLDREHVQSVEQIQAERLVRHGGRQVAIGGGDQHVQYIRRRPRTLAKQARRRTFEPQPASDGTGC
jgi:hypothetical protein